MDIPRFGQAQRASSFALPEPYIRNPNPSERKTMSSRSSFNTFSSPISSSAMSIPNARDDFDPPPPLPPPRIIHGYRDAGQEFGTSDPGWDFENACDSSWQRPSSVMPGSSLYGNSFGAVKKGFLNDHPDGRRESSTFKITSMADIDPRRSPYPADEGYASLSGSSMSSKNSRYGDLPLGRSGFQSSVHDKFRSNNAQTYDNSLLQKLNSKRGGDNYSPSRGGYGKTSFSTSLNDASSNSRLIQQHKQALQKPLSLPITTKNGSLENPFSRWAEGSLSATSPLSIFNSGHGPYDYRSPSERDDSEQSPRPYSRQTTVDSVFDDSASSISQPQGDQNLYGDNDYDFPAEETTAMHHLKLDDGIIKNEGHSPGSAAGQKRRASSPPRDDGPPQLHTATSLSDLYRRRESASRASPAPRYHSTHGSLSSLSSAPRNGSYNSPASTTMSSMTTMDSYRGLSPGGLSPGGLSPGAVSPRSIDSRESPFTGTLSVKASSQSRDPIRPSMPSRKSSDASSHSKNGVLKVQSGFVCDCCPKKPKKFDTEEELITHESEKQYECAYCKNRFKNKNEAERHQNSLHLRRHSWSCAALSSYVEAFHNSPIHPNEADTCGYCGDEFPRTGPGAVLAGLEGKIATERDWEKRIAHLIDIHKFRECNHTKKFFRADHFRQHLKHSHAGTSGKWTNMLENACMKDEPLPEPIRGPDRINEEEEQ